MGVSSDLQDPFVQRDPSPVAQSTLGFSTSEVEMGPRGLLALPSLRSRSHVPRRACAASSVWRSTL